MIFPSQTLLGFSSYLILLWLRDMKWGTQVRGDYSQNYLIFKIVLVITSRIYACVFFIGRITCSPFFGHKLQMTLLVARWDACLTPANIRCLPRSQSTILSLRFSFWHSPNSVLWWALSFRCLALSGTRLASCSGPVFLQKLVWPRPWVTCRTALPREMQ